MRKRNLLALLIFISALVIAIPANTQASEGDKKISQEDGNNSDTTRVFVKMKEKHESIKGFRTLLRKTETDTISVIKDKIEKKGGNVSRIYNNIDAVAIEITRDELEALKDDPNVEYVEEVRRAQAFLTESVPLINADDVWPENIGGVNITGISTSVCIIDTGVDTNHTDLAGRIVAEHCFCYPDCCRNGLAEDTSAEDDEGHGTHVAGIVAASGGINGVAKGANIVAVKALDSEGSGYFEDILAGVDWCITNAELYNITAISMSLGDSEYHNSTYCDNDDGAETMSNAVNIAVRNNISVVVATGNEFYTEGISFPACLYNTTKVTATDKSDNIDYYANRGGNFTDIVAAPGSSIYSTQMGGGYVTHSGTSMATPHVSGAVALFTQAYKLKYGYLPAPEYLKQILNDTGLQMYNATSGETYPRIDVFSAYTEIIRPRIITVSNSITEDNSSFIEFDIGETVAFNLSVNQNVSYIWLRNGTAAGTESQLIWITNGSDEGYWNVTVVAYNEDGLDSFEWTANIIKIGPDIEIMSPEEGALFGNRSVIFAYIAQDDEGFAGCALFTNESGWIAEEWNMSAIINDSLNNMTYEFASDGDYLWNIMCNDTDGQDALASANRTVIIDTTYPLIEIFEPEGNYSASMNLNFSAYDAHVDSCTYSLNGGDNVSVGCENDAVGLTGIVEGENYVNLCVNDTAGNMNCTSRIFGYDTTGPTVWVTEPMNDTYTNSLIYVNISTDEYSDSCIMDYGTGNITMNGSGRNFNMSFEADDRGYHITVSCNDTLGNTGINDSIYFTVDTTGPTIEIIVPINQTYNENSIIANISTDGTSWCALSINGGMNISMTNMSEIPSSEFWLNLSVLNEGWNNITAYCNDSAGNVNSSSSGFFVNIDYPHITLLAPEDTDTTDEEVELNYTVNGSFVVECAIYSNFSGIWSVNETNETAFASGDNISAIVYIDDGAYVWTAGCTDAGGKLYFAPENRTFAVDIAAPNISIIYPTNNTTAYEDEETVSVNITTDEYSYCRYNMSNESFDYDTDGMEMNTSDGLEHQAWINVSDGGNYTIYYRCRDIYGHETEESTTHQFIFELACDDNDGDGYGVGAGCLGTDCDDSNSGIYTGCTTITTSDSISTRSSSSGGGIIIGLAVAETNESDDEPETPENVTTTDEYEDQNITAITDDNEEDDSQDPEKERIAAEIETIKAEIESRVNNGKMDTDDAVAFNNKISEILALLESEDYQNADKIAKELKESVESAEIKTEEKADNLNYAVLGLLAIVTILITETVMARIARKSKNSKMIKDYIKMCMDKGFNENSIEKKLEENGWQKAYIDDIVQEVKKDENDKSG